MEGIEGGFCSSRIIMVEAVEWWWEVCIGAILWSVILQRGLVDVAVERLGGSWANGGGKRQH